MSRSADEILSKYMSWALRHEPEAIGLSLDAEGWADVDELIHCARLDGTELSRELILRLVDESSKSRFELAPDAQRIRSRYGHSTSAVDIRYPAATPPEMLYHGTATRFLESIRKQGLNPGERHYVFLSPTREIAHAVGQRHGKPCLLEIRAGDMARNGFVFHSTAKGIWMVKNVPVAYIVFYNK